MTTRDRLIISTQQLLWERGYVGTSPRAVLERADAGQGSMYHHFAGKADLALAAVQRTAEEMRELADRHLAGPGTAFERVSSWLHRERDVLRGCPIGGLAQDPDVIADPELRRPVQETMAWLQDRLASVLAEGRSAGEFGPGFDPGGVAAALVAVLQGGYVLARAADDAAPFHRAVDGALALLGGLRA